MNSFHCLFAFLLSNNTVLRGTVVACGGLHDRAIRMYTSLFGNETSLHLCTVRSLSCLARACCASKCCGCPRLLHLHLRVLPDFHLNSCGCNRLANVGYGLPQFFCILDILCSFFAHGSQLSRDSSSAPNEMKQTSRAAISMLVRRS